MAAAAPFEDGDFAPLDTLSSWHESRWPAQVGAVLSRSAFYRTLYRTGSSEHAVDVRLAAREGLPFADKEMLRASQRAMPPFGDYLACSDAAVARLHRTSGTTGTAMNLALSAADAAMTAAIGGRAQKAAGLGPGHRVVHCLNYQLWMGGYTDHAALEATGATVIPFGVGDTVRLIETIRELQVTAISCTPSYPAVLEQVIAAHFEGLAPRDLGLSLGLFGGESGLDDPAFRDRLEGVWGFAARNANYGVTDILCNFAGQCAKQTDLHFVALDVLFPELIDPETGAAKPWREGESGELVLTHLVKDCQPLIRFRTGDIITLTATGICRCGRTAPRFRVIGRSDDMVVVRGINVFPTMVTGAVHAFAALSGEYRIRLAGGGPYDALPLEAEMAASMDEASDSLARQLEDRIKAAIGVTARVTLMPYGTLPRTAGKTPRVVREP